MCENERMMFEAWIHYTISRNRMTYNAEGKRTSLENLAGQVTTTAWDCCFAYTYNNRSERTNAVAAVDSNYRYAYDFDEIGNREASSERGTNSAYTANQLNQYTAVDDFIPQFDDDGNQTLIKTSTGIWSVTYNGENRPVRWTQGNTLISMSYDRMGRRVTKNDQRFIYDGYLQIANFEHQTSNIKHQTFIWDPTEPVATRPLAWLRGNSVSYYTHDGNKNVSEVIASDGALAAHYDYAPFGAVTAQRGTSAASTPWRFSSEYAEDETATVYYNYRHYEPMAGRWLTRDPIEEVGGFNMYSFCLNRIYVHDALGRKITYNYHRWGEPKKKDKDTRDRNPSKQVEDCVLIVTIDWYLKFPKDWDKSRRDTWSKTAVDAVQSYFTSDNLKKKCFPEPGCCICKNGVSIKVLINLLKQPQSGAQEFRISVEDTDNGGSWNDNGAHRGAFDTRANVLHENSTGEKQIQVVHEVGHQLGLHHPGGKSNDHAAYMADAPSLMGGGMEMRTKDFNSAFCSKIKSTSFSRNVQPKCGKWEVKEIK